MIFETLTYDYINQHIDEILLLEKSIFDKSKELYDSTPWQKMEFISERKNKDLLSCLVRDGHRLVGFSVSYEFTRQYAHISRFAIAPAYAGKGFGSKLIQYQLALLEHHKYTCCSVDLVRKNTRAISLYERHGFKMLQGQELEQYVKVRDRVQFEYLGPTLTHTAMVLKLW